MIQTGVPMVMTVDPEIADPRWDIILPGEPIELTETQWADIVRLSGLPSEARTLIGKAIALFRNVEKTAGRYTARQTRDELKKVQKDALALHRSLVKLMANPHAHYAVTVPSVRPGGWTLNIVPGSRIQAQRRFDTSLETLQHLANWLALASDRTYEARCQPQGWERALAVGNDRQHIRKVHR